MSSSGETVSREDLLWLMGSLSGLHRVPFNPNLIAQAFPPPCTRAVLHEAARSLGFKTGTCRTLHLDWAKLPLPAIAFLRPHPPADRQTETEAAPQEGGPPSARPVLILKSDGSSLLFFRPGTQTPESIGSDEAATRFQPELMLVGRESAPAEGPKEKGPGSPEIGIGMAGWGRTKLTN